MNILEDFGIDEEDVNWTDFAACVGYDPEYFSKYYEDRPELRPMVDGICITCPVFKECITTAITRKESFVWGATYFDNGSPVPEKMEHQTPEFKQKMVNRINE
jgi:hypothetical protein